MLVTDDQTLEEMVGLPRTAALLGGQGTTFSRAYISYPLCCPSRAAILTGQYMHNNGVHGNNPPIGGWQRFRAEGLEERDLPNWLRSAGYYNVQIGKYLNGYNGNPPPIPPAWNEWYGKYSEYDASQPGAELYFHYRLRETPPVAGGLTCPSGNPEPAGQPFTCSYENSPSDYQTDVFRDLAVNAIHRLSGSGGGHAPFFLNVDFNAPHPPASPATRDQGVLAGLPLAPEPGTNEKNLSDKPFFLRRLPKLGSGEARGDRPAPRQPVRDADRRGRGDRRDRPGADRDRPARQHLPDLHLRQRLLQRRAPHPSGEVPAPRTLQPRSHVDPGSRDPGGRGLGRAGLERRHRLDDRADRPGRRRRSPRMAARCCPSPSGPRSSATRPVLLEGDTGSDINDEGQEGPTLQTTAARKFKKKQRRRRKKLKRRCHKLARKSPKRALICFRQGVRNIEQEPVDHYYTLSAPAYRGIRTDRYALFLYATGEIELYDMWPTPSSSPRSPRWAATGRSASSFSASCTPSRPAPGRAARRGSARIPGRPRSSSPVGHTSGSPSRRRGRSASRGSERADDAAANRSLMDPIRRFR